MATRVERGIKMDERADQVLDIVRDLTREGILATPGQIWRRGKWTRDRVVYTIDELVNRGDLVWSHVEGRGRVVLLVEGDNE